MKTISIVAGCFNEGENIRELYERVRKCFDALPAYAFELILIDNASTDNTVDVLRSVASEDRRVKVILNTRNFGAVRSGYHALLKARGDAVVTIASDLQDPPELISSFVEKWEQGFKVVLGIKTNSEESSLMFSIRKSYYPIIGKLSTVGLVRNFTGFGLYDQRVIEVLRTLQDPYPYFRGLICELGFERAEVEFTQPRRKRGRSSYNLYSLYDFAMLGITNHSKVPLRLATFAGFCLAGLSLLIAIVYFFYKILYWNSFELGAAPATIGLFFFSAVQLIFIGIVGEYIGAIHTQILRRPLVVEKELINFD